MLRGDNKYNIQKKFMYFHSPFNQKDANPPWNGKVISTFFQKYGLYPSSLSQKKIPEQNVLISSRVSMHIIYSLTIPTELKSEYIP